MRKQNKLALAIALAIATGSMSIAAAQSAADFQDEEYYKSTGLDLINAAEAYTAGYTGRGITLGISDTPVNFLNPEFSLKKNSKMGNITYMVGKAAGIYDWSVLNHGTHVAGIAAADRNGIGMQGVAYEAETVGCAYGAGLDNGGSGEIRTDAYDYYLAHPEIKVINNSWGAETIRTQWE